MGVALCFAACGGKSEDKDAGPRDDAGPGQDASTGRDASADLDATAGLDAATDAATDAAVGVDASVGQDAGPTFCGDCAAREPVALFHQCTPPLEGWCPIQACPNGNECGLGETCEDCAAAACCECGACVPACVFTGAGLGPGELPPLLKIQPSWGPSGEEIDVQGTPFYIGALGYTILVGEEEALQVSASGPCSLIVLAPEQPEGTMLPVWSSQYGFGKPFVLAGFFSYTDGEAPSCVQPGFQCDGNQDCCDTPEVPLSCTLGRCQRD
jgi:hypothetical protein